MKQYEFWRDIAQTFSYVILCFSFLKSKINQKIFLSVLCFGIGLILFCILKMFLNTNKQN